MNFHEQLRELGGGVEMGDWIWKETDKTTIAITTNAWNNEQAKKSVNQCMYIVTTYLQKKKPFIIKFPSKLKKIMTYTQCWGSNYWIHWSFRWTKKRRKVIIGTSLITVLIPTSPLHLSFPFQKENSNLTTPSNKNHWNLL